MAKYRRKTSLVQAVQLLWSTWSEVCDLLKDGSHDPLPGYVGCYIDRDGAETDDANGRIGLKRTDVPDSPDTNPNQAVVAIEGDWVIRDGTGLYFWPQASFAEQFQPFDEYAVDYAPQWLRYPRLAIYFMSQQADPELLKELRALLTDARADAVQYVHDVRADELAKARADERERMAGGVVSVKKLMEPIRGITNVLLKYDEMIRIWPANTFDIVVKGGVAPSGWRLPGHPESGAALHEALKKFHGRREQTEYELIFRDVCDKTYRSKGRIEMPDTLGVRSTAGSVRDLTDPQLLQALRNMGCYLDECDACAEVFFTGSKTHDHTCPKGR